MTTNQQFAATGASEPGGFGKSLCGQNLKWILRTIVTVFIVVAFSNPLIAIPQETDHIWRLAESDCQVSAKTLTIDESDDDFRSAPTSSRIDFQAAWGTRVMVATPVTHSLVISELSPSLWVKGTRKKIQLYARVVLPCTSDPTESGPMTVLLPGPVYENPGRWQRLDFADIQSTLPELLERAVWKLRTRFKEKVDSNGAYLDMLVLNVYTGKGPSTVWVDDINISGIIQATPDAGALTTGNVAQYPVRQVGFQQESNGDDNRRPSLTSTNGSILEVRGRPFFARSIQHNGEPFEFLADLGFNTIELSQTATLQQLQLAERLDIWLVCPAPSSAGLHPISAEYDRVLAWSLGNNLDYSDLQRIEARIREIDQSDFRTDRPTIAFVGSGVFDIARLTDILGVGLEPIGGSFDLRQYSDWLQQRSRLAQKSLPLWAAVQTEMPETIRSQTAAMGLGVPPMPLEASQMKQMVYEAIAGGCRGMRFLSRSRLDVHDNPVAALRSLSLAWLNAHLNQLEPWVSGGAVVGQTESGRQRDQLTTLATPRARLVLIQRESHSQPLTDNAVLASDFQFSEDTLGSSESAYHLSESGVIPLDQGRSLTGNQITVPNCGDLEAVLVTSDAQVINRMAESYLLNGQETIAQMHLAIARQWMAIVSLINEQLTRIGQGDPTATGSIDQAGNALRQAQALVENGSAITANRLMYVADQKLATAGMQILSSARNRFLSETATPLLTHMSLVPLHFQLISQISPDAWQPNGLAGGDFENLDHMTGNGWENHRVDHAGIGTRVELSNESPVDGRRALLMSVTPSGSAPEPGLVDRTPLWINSGPVPVKAGQLVRIHGWVKIDQPISGSLDGLMIIDSIAGPGMAERMVTTNGWQEFSFYRCARQNGQMRLTFALTGYGAVMIDEVDIRAIDLPGQTRQARKE